ncbi:MAG: sodium:solute symporter family transporter [Planctomycetota bacterium]
MHWMDLVIIGFYLVAILIAGIYLTRLASRNIDSYFLGGRQIPWWLLGLSGTASYFDVSGVMWTIAFFYIMGLRFMWIQWEWGFVIMLAAFAAYMGKWLRRSKVLTGAEWMNIRFGRGPAGEFARVSYAILAVVIAVAFIGFAEYGCGHFLHMFIPSFSPHTLAIFLMTATAIYTLCAGLFGVVLTDFIQFCIILLGSSILIIKAISMGSYEAIAREVPPEWFGFVPMWKWDHLNNWEMTKGFSLFFLMFLVWSTKGVLLGAGGPQQLYDMQRFLAARNPRSAGKAGMLWGAAMTPMFMLSAAVAIIGIVKFGGKLPHPEHLYPVVIGTMLPIGVKGLVLAGLLSAFMSTFSSTVNAGAAYLVRDGYQNFLRPKASSRELIFVSRICSGLVIVAGILVGMQASNIDTIFGWIMITLGTAVLMPNVLRWFWWRFNGVGYAVGTLSGVFSSIAAAIWFGETRVYISFPILFGISAVTSIIASLLTPPASMETLKDFYLRIRPAGWWRPVRRIILSENLDIPSDSFTMDILTVIIGVTGLQALYMLSVYACTHQWQAFTVAFLVVAGCAVALYFTWYKNLPSKDEDVQQV